MYFRVGKRCVVKGYWRDPCVKWYFDIKIFKLRIHCLRDNGDWFLYFTKYNGVHNHGFRFSSAGYMKW